MSDYSLRLAEKQKIRMNYGLSETQLRRYVKRAASSRLETGERLSQLLESRLDSIVFRAGLAPTIPAARQLVNHGHIRLNGRKTDIPSAQVRVGSVIELKARSQRLACVVDCLSRPTLPLPDYLSLISDPPQVTMTRLPGFGDIPFALEMHLVVEYYAR